jgi:transposase
MQGKKPHQEKIFTHFQLSNHVPDDNFYRRLNRELDLKFLYPLTAKYYGVEGPPSIDVTVFFKLILVGYLENLNSDRRIIAHASMRMDILFFVGYDLDEPLPWHSTLSRTRQLFGHEVFEALFLKVLEMCVKKGMVGGKRQAVDSAYIKANASMDSLLEKEVMEDGKIFTMELVKNEEDKPKQPPTKPEIDLGKQVSAQKKKEVDGHHKWQEKAYKGQPQGRKNPSEDSFDEEKETDSRKRNKFLSNHTHYSSTDPDARISVKPGKPRQLTFTAQTTTDTKQHVITNILADFSDFRDSESVKKIVNQTQDNLKYVGLKMEELLADTGYSSGHSLSYLKFWGITGYIPNFGQYKNSRPGFTYDPEKNHYTCQNGKILTCKGIRTNDTNEAMYQLYYSKKADCIDCPFKATCIGNGEAKKLTDTIDKHLYDEMHERLQTRKAKRYKKLRSSTVEPVLGTLINFTGMRRIWTRGIDQANKFMIGAAIAYNLRKWLKYSPKPRKKAEAMAKDCLFAKNALSDAFLVCYEQLVFELELFLNPKLPVLNRL